jgi:hypothetical protein
VTVSSLTKGACDCATAGIAKVQARNAIKKGCFT